MLNGKGQEEIVFCELVPQASVTIRSSAPWLKLSDSGEIIDLETLDLGALKDGMTEQSLSAKKGQRKVLLLEYDGFDIANGSEPRSADITIDTDLGDHLVMQVIQGENIYEYTYDYFDPLVITAQGLGGPFQYGSTDVVGGLKPTPYNGNQDFTRETWRDEEYIMIYTKKGDEEDFKGKKGYEIIPLPWNRDFTVSNMAADIDLQSRQQKFINSSAGGMSGLVSALIGGAPGGPPEQKRVHAGCDYGQCGRGMEGCQRLRRGTPSQSGLAKLYLSIPRTDGR